MTHSSHRARTLRFFAEYRWTNRKAHAFRDALPQHGKVAAAARSAGMTRSDGASSPSAWTDRRVRVFGLTFP